MSIFEKFNFVQTMHISQGVPESRLRFCLLAPEEGDKDRGVLGPGREKRLRGWGMPGVRVAAIRQGKVI